MFEAISLRVAVGLTHQNIWSTLNVDVVAPLIDTPTFNKNKKKKQRNDETKAIVLSISFCLAMALVYVCVFLISTQLKQTLSYVRISVHRSHIGIPERETFVDKRLLGDVLYQVHDQVSKTKIYEYPLSAIETLHNFGVTISSPILYCQIYAQRICQLRCRPKINGEIKQRACINRCFCFVIT